MADMAVRQCPALSALLSESAVLNHAHHSKNCYMFHFIINFHALHSFNTALACHGWALCSWVQKGLESSTLVLQPLEVPGPPLRCSTPRSTGICAASHLSQAPCARLRCPPQATRPARPIWARHCITAFSASVWVSAIESNQSSCANA